MVWFSVQDARTVERVEAESPQLRHYYYDTTILCEEGSLSMIKVGL